MPPRMNMLADPLSLVLAPVSLQDFLDDHWEQSPLHISRDSTEHFSDLLELEQIEMMFSSQELRYPSVQLTRSDDPVAASLYTDDASRISALALIELHTAGATIVISQAHDKLASLAAFRRSVQRTFNLRCQTNVYLSPPGKQGFNAHYDSHDVFILQVKGTKTFNFYGGGVVLPYSHEGFDSDVHAAGELQESITVQPGDTLYIPRGVMHDALANDDTSLHITLGMYAVTLRDVMLEAVQSFTDQDVQFRRSLPSGQLTTDDKGTHDLAAKLCTLLQEGFGAAHVDDALAQLNDDIALDAQPDCAGLLEGASVHASLAVSSTVQIRDASIINVQRIGSSVRCRALATVLEFEDPLGAALQQLHSTGTMRVADLGDLSEDQQLALCQRLLHANLLEII